MKNEKEKWIEEVFESLKGIQRAKPDSDLLAKIESRIDGPKSGIIPINHWRFAAAAAILLLALNALSVRQYLNNNTGEVEVSGIDIAYQQQIISNYQLYE